MTNVDQNFRPSGENHAAKNLTAPLPAVITAETSVNNLPGKEIMLDEDCSVFIIESTVKPVVTPVSVVPTIYQQRRYNNRWTD